MPRCAWLVCVCRFHNQYLVLDALVRQAQALVEGVFVQKLKTMRMEEAERKAESKSAHLTEEELAAQERKLRRAEDALADASPHCRES